LMVDGKKKLKFEIAKKNSALPSKGLFVFYQNYLNNYYKKPNTNPYKY